MADSTTPLLKPELYAVDASGAPILLGGRCECGYVFFPMQTFGCERCGRAGSALQPFALAARGRLRSAATVHVHADEKRAAPFVIGTIALDDGPLVRTLLVDPPPDREAPGTRVEAILMPVATSQSEREAMDLRFRPTSAA
jgi:uncharacterized OB-fold protein